MKPLVSPFNSPRLWIGLVLALSLSAARAKLNVVATTGDLGALAEAIGGKHIKLTTLARPTEDPHFVDPRPSFIVKLNRADVLIEGGAELEIGWLPALLAQARNPKLRPGSPGRIVASEGIRLLEVPTQLDRSRGDLHRLGNPHFLTDPANARIVATHIARTFSQLDPGAAADYQASLKAFLARLDTHLKAWEALLAPYRGQHIVAYHNAWPYFSQRFGIHVDIFLEPKPGIPPSPAHLAEVIQRMRSEHIRVIIVQPYVSRRTAERVASATGAVVVDVTQYPGGVRGTEDGYIECWDYVIKAIAKALAGGSSAQ